MPELQPCRDKIPKQFPRKFGYWLIVRGLKSMPKNPLGNIRHVPVLAPSQALWYHYLDLKKAGNWNEQIFLSDYAPRFLSEMLQPEQKAKLQELCERPSGFFGMDFNPRTISQISS